MAFGLSNGNNWKVLFFFSLEDITSIQAFQKQLKMWTRQSAAHFSTLRQSISDDCFCSQAHAVRFFIKVFNAVLPEGSKVMGISVSVVFFLLEISLDPLNLLIILCITDVKVHKFLQLFY